MSDEKPKMKIHTLKEVYSSLKGREERKGECLGYGSINADRSKIDYADTLFVDEMADGKTVIILSRIYEPEMARKTIFPMGIAMTTDRKYEDVAKDDDPLFNTFGNDGKDFALDTFFELSELWDGTVTEELELRREKMTAMHERIEADRMYTWG
jgi:hypothetical protein